MKIFVITFSLLLLTACTTRFTYNNLDWLLYWYLDDYVELTDEQKAQVDPYLNNWLTWHRGTELPKYLSHFDMLSEDIANKNITSESLDKHQALLIQHWHRLKERIVPDLVTLAPSLEKEQIDELFIALADDNQEERDELAERLAKSPEKQKEEWLDKRNERMSRWLGKLSDEQLGMLEESYPFFESTRGLRITYLETYQTILKQRLLKLENPPTQSQIDGLTQLLMEPDSLKSNELVNKSDINAQVSKVVLISLSQSLSDKQRVHLLDELEDLKGDFQALLN